MRPPPCSASPGGHALPPHPPPIQGSLWSKEPSRFHLTAEETGHVNCPQLPGGVPTRAPLASLSARSGASTLEPPGSWVPPTGPPLCAGHLLTRSSLSLLPRHARHTNAHPHGTGCLGHSLPSLPCCRSESVIVNNFFSSVDGQLELLGQATLDSSVSSMGALHALRPRLSHFHQLLFEPLEVGRAV